MDLRGLYLFAPSLCFLQFCCQVSAAKLVAPIEPDGKRAECYHKHYLKKAFQRERVGSSDAGHGEVKVYADEQSFQRGVDELKPKISPNDVIYSLTERCRHLDNVLHQGFRDIAHSNPQCPDNQKVNVECHSQLAYAEWFENG